MKKTLEKIVNSVKEVGRTIKRHGFKIATAVALPFIFNYNAGAGELTVWNWSSKTSAGGDWMTIKHVEGAQEGWDPDDFPHTSGPDPLQIYSNNPNHNPNELRVDARGPNSTSTFHTELYNNGGFPGFADNHLRFYMFDSNDCKWKNMFLGGADDSNDIVADIKYIIVNGSILGGIPYGDIDLPDVQGSKTGVYDKRKVPIFNHADLNRDRKVNFVDWAIYANAYKEGRTDIEKGSNPNALEDYADIENFYDANGVMVSYGNGTADANDRSLFMSEWLWDADDANTW